MKEYPTCVNLDWLEVYCTETKAHDYSPDAFRARGYDVLERAYGTPQYAQMFTVIDCRFPLVEIRRLPYSLKTQGGIFPPGATHIRLTNRACYEISPVDVLRRFLLANHYTLVSISRIDICLDFNKFGTGRDPQMFVHDFMKERVKKINQCRLAAHGTDAWHGRVWNSLKWGASTSIVTTKLYNKTLELNQQKDKFYIRDRWEEAGLNPSDYVWRVEFSLKPAALAQLDKGTGEYVEQKLTDYDTRDKLLTQFYILANKYFRFKWSYKTNTGKELRKDRCPDVKLFQPGKLLSQTFTPVRVLTKQTEPTKTDKMLINRLLELSEREEETRALEAIHFIVSKMIYNMRMRQYDRRLAKLGDKIQNTEILKPVKHILTPKEMTLHAQEQETKERKLMAYLMQKYGVLANSPAYCPF